MTNHERAANIFRGAEWAYQDLERALADKEWNIAVRRAQEVVELALKGLLALMGVDYPKERDPADVFARAVRERGLGIEEETLQEIQVFSTRLARRRAPAFYFEVRVEEQEARRAANDAAQMLKWVQEWRKWLEGS
jgi:HEPN domain-containing protein